jgi:hypothetical protein
MIEDILQNKYGESLKALDIYETNTSLKLTRIIVNPETRDTGVGSNVMQDLVKYADDKGKIVTLTPSKDFGGNVNRLVQFYKRFGFKMNKGHNKNFQFMDTMIRYPKLAGMKENFKPLIKNLLREAIDKTIKCKKCGWKWKLKDGGDDPYVCHKCHPENIPKKKPIKEALLNKTDADILKVTDFVNFAKDYLEINDDIKISLAFEKTPDIRTTAYYNNEGFIKVYVKDRAIIDVCRSIAHELVHHKQNLDGRFEDAVDPGEDGSEFENEANSVAGVLIRKWGRIHPEIYT